MALRRAAVLWSLATVGPIASGARRGALPDSIDDAIQADIVNAGYGK